MTRLLAIPLLLAAANGAHARDFSSLMQTPVRSVSIERPASVPATKPIDSFCLGAVWPTRIARCELTVKF